MKLDFVKLHGLGNDFVFIDDFSLDVELSPNQVRYLCDRNFGIGADGVILVRPSQNPECVAYMHYINSDGSLSEMCGNGVRCFAKYLVDRAYVSSSVDNFLVDTLAGPRRIAFMTDGKGKLVEATVDMGEPVFAPDKIPTTLLTNAETSQGFPFVCEQPVSSPWGDFSFTCVSMGNPHAVCFIEEFSKLSDELFCDPQKNLSNLNLNLIGAFYETASVFPEKANIEFAVVEEQGITMRVFERGCGETLACGTGACATSVAASVTGRASLENEVFLRGGTLKIAWNEGNRVMMTGPATEVFSGTIKLPL